MKLPHFFTHCIWTDTLQIAVWLQSRSRTQKTSTSSTSDIKHSLLAQSLRSTYSFTDSGSGSCFTADGRNWTPRLLRTAQRAKALNEGGWATRLVSRASNWGSLLSSRGKEPSALRISILPAARQSSSRHSSSCSVPRPRASSATSREMGVWPFRLVTWTWAPYSSSTRTLSRLPFMAAQLRGVSLL